MALTVRRVSCALLELTLLAVFLATPRGVAFTPAGSSRGFFAGGSSRPCREGARGPGLGVGPLAVGAGA